MEALKNIEMWSRAFIIINTLILSNCEINGFSSMFRSLSNPFSSRNTRDSRCESSINIKIVIRNVGCVREVNGTVNGM